MKTTHISLTLLRLLLASSLLGGLAVRAAAPVLSGELKQWHKVTLTLDGPQATETDNEPNPFTDYRMDVTFTHESGSPSYKVPGYFAADGNAAETSASSGNKWRAHLSPDKTGKWTFKVSFTKGKNASVDDTVRGTAVPGCDGASGSFSVAPTDKTGRDFRAKGRLTYVGGHYLQFALFPPRATPSRSRNTWLRFTGGTDVPGQAALGDGWKKIAMLGHPENWTWNTHADPGPRHPLTPVCRAFPAGVFRLEFSGRSFGHALDRFVLRRYDSAPVKAMTHRVRHRRRGGQHASGLLLLAVQGSGAVEHGA